MNCLNTIRKNQEYYQESGFITGPPHLGSKLLAPSQTTILTKNYKKNPDNAKVRYADVQE